MSVSDIKRDSLSRLQLVQRQLDYKSAERIESIMLHRSFNKVPYPQIFMKEDSEEDPDPHSASSILLHSVH